MLDDVVHHKTSWCPAKSGTTEHPIVDSPFFCPACFISSSAHNPSYGTVGNRSTDHNCEIIIMCHLVSIYNHWHRVIELPPNYLAVPSTKQQQQLTFSSALGAAVTVLCKLVVHEMALIRISSRN
jgi:hypothetical protein